MSTIPPQHVAHQAEDYVHDLLSPSEAESLENHLRECDDCRRAVEQARRRHRLLQSIAPSEPSTTLVARTIQYIADHGERQKQFRRRLAGGVFAVLSAAAVLLLTCNLYYSLLQPSTLDLILLGQRELLAATNASARIRLIDRKNGSGVAGVPIRVELRASDGRIAQLGQFVTDELGSGSPRLEMPDWEEGRYELAIYAAAPASPEVLTQPVQLRRAARLMLSTDKPIYQPGQTIQARALILRRPDLKPVANQEAVFTLADPRNNILFKQRQKTSAYGLCATECPLANEIQEGVYTLTCKVGEVESKQSIEIRRYVLPKFKIEVTPDRPYYAPGQMARVQIQADYFFGKPVENGEVVLSVRANDPAGRQLSLHKARTDARGSAQIAFAIPAELIGRPQDEGDARLHFVVTLTDSAGQTQSRVSERLVTIQPIRIDAVAENGNLVPGIENTVYVLVRRVDGTPVGKVEVLAQGDGLEARASIDEQGTGSFTFTPAEGETVCLIRVRDTAGNVLARQSVKFSTSGQSGDFLVRTDRATYKAGQSLTVRILGSGKEPVFLDILKDGQTLLSQTVSMSDGQGEQTIDLPPDLFGTLQLIAYRFQQTEGLPLRKRRVIYVAPPEGLQIKATLDQPEYRPGKQAQLSLRLTDAQGKPTPGAISLVGVDEAVFSVQSQRPGLEQTFYTLEEELLRPIYTIYPAWTPEDDSPNREQALFAHTSEVIPAEAASSNPHSLSGRTFPEKEQRVRDLKAKRLEQVSQGWMILGATTACCLYAGLWLFLPFRWVLGGHILGVLLLVPLLLSQPRAVQMIAGRDMLPIAPEMARMAVSAPDGFGGAMPKSEARLMLEAGAEMSQDRSAEAEPPRVRRSFPETLLWKPQLLTDEQGRLPPLSIELADSITTWRLSASAVAADGRLGATTLPLKVFQPFFVDLQLPVHLTRGDEIGLPVVVYNYLDRPQTVTLTLADADWFARQGPAEQKLELAANEVRSTRYTICVRTVGKHRLAVQALASKIGDAIEREVEVVPDGRRVESIHNGSLAQPADVRLDLPEGLIEGSAAAFLKLYPSGFSQLVEGLDNIFRMPYGCFEQTSSTTYPNILALDYLRRNHLSSPATEARARQYIHLGYQRLVGFEVPGGGFDWYGQPPANLTLTAYGLLQFEDMARVHEVDPRLIERTRNWLLAQRKADGSWALENRGAHLAGFNGDERTARVGLTAYVAWAVFGNGQSANQRGSTLDWLLSHQPGTLNDPHTLALVCNALLAIDPQLPELPAYLDRLAALAHKSADGKHVYWQRPLGQRTFFYGAGLSGQVETTALASLALLKAKRQPALVRGALTWLVSVKDANGTWHSTQATVLALKALLAGTGGSLGEGERRIEIQLGQHRQSVVIPADQAEVLQQIDLSKHLRAGANTLSLTEKTGGNTGYQVVFRYHVPEKEVNKATEPLAIELTYDRTELTVGDTLQATVRIKNNMPAVTPMVMLDLPVPPGFAPDTEALDQLVRQNFIARYQVTSRQILVYLRSLTPGQPLILHYRLRATMPVKATAAAARIYEYYDPQKQARTQPRQLLVKARD
jgi:uncharacterized protein YfaS (alpha-2-macroglobulin family)